MDIGQEIGIARSTRYGYMYIQYGTVTKINGHGHIFVAVDGEDALLKILDNTNVPPVYKSAV